MKEAIRTSVRSAATNPADALAQTPAEKRLTISIGSVSPNASVSFMNLLMQYQGQPMPAAVNDPYRLRRS